MFARTERLLLRPGWAEDAPALARAMNDEAIVRNLASAPWPYDLASAQAWVERSTADGLPNFLLFQRTSGAPRLIGGAGIGKDDIGGDGYELGYWIARPYWGLGYATEAARHVLTVARTLKLPRLTAAHFIDNAASGKVLRKLGFRATGKIAPRYSHGRGEDALCAEYTESDISGHDDPAVMRRKRSFSQDMRDDWRLLAA